MYKMIFNTGVRAENRRCNGELITMEHDVWVDGVLHIEYWLEYAPLPNYIFLYLCNTGDTQGCQIAIPVVGGGMLSKYAIFFKL